MSLFGLFYRDQLKTPNLDEFENLTSRMSGWALREHNEDGTHNVRPSGFDFVPIGAMTMWSGPNAPGGWLLCDGSQISRTTYQALFNVIGTTYGAGDGTTTFTIPDLRQRFPLGKSAAGTGSVLGSSGGTIDHAHTGGSVTGSTAAGTTGTATTGTGTSGGQSADHVHNFGVTSGAPSASTDRATGGTGAIVPVVLHTHDVAGTTAGTSNDHTHSVPGLSIPGLSIPALGAGTLAIGTGGTQNPPYVVVQYIILSGV